MLTPSCLYKTILLIDDDEDDCYLFYRAVTEITNDVKVNCTRSSDNLLKVSESTKPSIIFIDLHLPKHSGLECLRLIRSQPVLYNIPVIFWSGSCDSRNMTTAYSEGAQYFFEKPCSLDDLMQELKNIIYVKKVIRKLSLL
jgi:CheY-like chemotaxis protein